MISKKQKNTFLSFGIHKETFAVSVKKVPEVLQKQYITKIPNTPDFIEGVINFRGNIIPAVEMRTKFGLPPREKDEQYVIIVFDLTIDKKKIMVGAIADKVNDVIAFEDANIKPVPDLGLEYNAEFIKGMVKSGESFIMILDIDEIFSKEEVNIIRKAKITNGKNMKKQTKQSTNKKAVADTKTKNSKNTKKK
jgi:purine-binding chemotaxis protein CheW